jgi:hypothetical protein
MSSNQIPEDPTANFYKMIDKSLEEMRANYRRQILETMHQRKVESDIMFSDLQMRVQGLNLSKNNSGNEMDMK